LRENLAFICNEEFALKCDSDDSPDDPITLSDVMKSAEREKWKLAMKEEMASIQDNKTYDLVKLPTGKRFVKSRWVFKLKKGPDGKAIKYKARLVAKGYTQRYGVDYDETYSPVVRYTSVRLLMGIAVQRKMKIHQMDAITPFLQ
jgi:hypothetical protein